ncbi:FtsX-like permease family protein [Paenibacillus rhizoplanae]
MIVLESIFYGLFASVVGITLGTALSYSIQMLFAGAVSTAWTIPWYSIGIAFAGAIITTLLATIWPMYQLNKVNIVEALRREN